MALVFVLMAAINVYAQDADGVWVASIPGESDVVLAMTRESVNDLLILTFLSDWDGTMNAWIPFAGRIDNNTGTLSLVLTSQENGNIPSSATGLFNLTSPTTATFTVITCSNYPGQSSCLPIGSVFNFTRLF
jgi:hypothetical protein